MTTAEPTAWQRLWHTRLRDLFRGQVDGSLDWRREISAAELPANVRAVVHEVVRRTRLWRREKVDVARELIAHFQDGLDAGRSPEQLLESFGDPRQAAQLIRRAKRRGRSMVWQLWRWACLAAGALLVAYLAMVLYQLTGRPTIKVNYVTQINARALSAREEERAWPIYRQALSQMMVAHSWPAWAGDSELATSDASWPAAVDWLKAHEGALALVREATTRPELGFAVGVSPKSFSPADQQLFFEPNHPALDPNAPPRDRIEDQTLVSVHLPHLYALRNTARVLAIDSRRAALAGDGETALADVRAMLGIAEHVQQMPCLIVTVTALAVQRMAYDAVEDILSRRPELWSVGQMRDLAHSIAASDVDWRAGIEGERAMFYDIVQRFYTDDGHGDGRLAFRGPEAYNVVKAIGMLAGSLYTDTVPTPRSDWVSDGLAALALPAANLAVASRKETIEKYDRFTDRAAEQIETPLWTPVTPLDDEISALSRQPLGQFRYLFLNLLLPAYDAVRNLIAETAGDRDGALIGLALESYRREHDAWPKSLDELSPRWLPAVPVDLITGNPLGYKIVDERPVVYSVGVDRDDDGSRRTPDPDGHDPSGTSKTDDSRSEWPPRGSGPANLASPAHFQQQPAKDRQHDGDWVIWSTAAKK